MKHVFHLPQFPNSTFEIETSIWTGKSKLIMDNEILEKIDEKGKPFLIPTHDAGFVKAFPKSSFPDAISVLEINGENIQILERLEWYQYVIGGLPILLLFVGGAIGGGIGAVGAVTNFSIFRQEGSDISKYLKVIGVIVGSYLLYLLVAGLSVQLFKK
ncbi:hypothetical protein [Spirosoma aerolatum]|uniref:hypothetical protein n=1 Tax=Spirosoma aerolatum TaxID=1211326 RepID=UPI0009AC7475|nr:hypothetical protein [Spirosoma aerolatum]